MGREQRERYRRRYENSFDLLTDESYNQWRELRAKLDRQVIESGGTCPCHGACSCSCRGVGFCDCLGPILSSPIPPPTANATVPSQSPVADAHQPSPRQQPKEYTISTATGDIFIDQDLCSIMLQPATANRGEGRKRRQSLDPGNKCITGKVFLDALRAETERKEREEKEKEEKKRERVRLAEEKKKKAEEKRQKAQEKKEKNKKKKEEKKKIAPKRKGIGKTKVAAKKTKIDDLLTEKESYSCMVCEGKYVEEDPDEWVECDFCDSWFHVRCTNLPVLDALDENIDFTCSFCVDKGFPSHVF